MAPPYDPRTIALLSEIVYTPLELQASAVQEIHNELYQHPQFSYQNFGVAGDGITLSNPQTQPGLVSSATFQPDRMHVREELGGVLVDDFISRLEHVVAISIDKLSLPILVAQQHVVRSLVTPRNFEDSREFLATSVCSLPHDDFAAFERPVGLYGMKLIFPADEQSDSFHTVRIESFNQDPRCVFIEDVATYTTPVQIDSIEVIGESMNRTYAFVRDRVLAFLTRYDERVE